MNGWQDFYQSVKDPSWPDCNSEAEFVNLPQWIQDECQQHGYDLGQYFKQSPLPNKIFPINTATSCKLKWTWSTLYLNSNSTASCHRTNFHTFDIDSFEFHNTDSKIKDRQSMLQGVWPEKGCYNCKRIEQSGGQSDRITSNQMSGLFHPPELDVDPQAVTVTPRMLEVYFDNTCNLKCVYCGPMFSSLWSAEVQKYGGFEKDGLIMHAKSPELVNTEKSKQRLFEWLLTNGQDLTHFNILGGEPLYQTAFDEFLELVEKQPFPMMDLQIFTNLNCKPEKLRTTIAKVKKFVDQGHLRAFTITASLDCWGPEQEYTRFPLDLSVWEQNFEILVHEHWIKLIVGSTLTVLTVWTLAELIERINKWRKIRDIHHYFNEVDQPSQLMVDILGNALSDDFDRAIALVPEHSPEQINTKNYLRGIAKQSQSKGVDRDKCLKMVAYLDELDRRRNTNWAETFPKLWDFVKTNRLT